MNLEEILVNGVQDYLKSEAFEEMIQSAVGTAVKSAVNSVFGYNFEIKQKLQEKINSVLTPVIEQWSFEDYELKLEAVLNQIVSESLIGSDKQLLTNFYNVISTPEKEVWTPEDIFDKYLECCGQDIDTSNLEINSDETPFYEGGQAYMGITKSRFNDNQVMFSFNTDYDSRLAFSFMAYHLDTDKADEYGISYNILDFVSLGSLSQIDAFKLFICKLKKYGCKIKIEDKDVAEFKHEIEVEATPEANYI